MGVGSGCIYVGYIIRGRRAKLGVLSTIMY